VLVNNAGIAWKGDAFDENVARGTRMTAADFLFSRVVHTMLCSGRELLWHASGDAALAAYHAPGRTGRERLQQGWKVWGTCLYRASSDAELA
jgi:hypothetical protein